MRMVARRIGAIVLVGILAITVGRGWPAMAQGRGNILTLALHFYPSTLDPAIGVAGPHYRVFVNTYEGLIGYERGTAKVVPSLAQSWTSSPDLTTYTFKLRPGVQFHDGTTLDAEAVKLSFDRVKKRLHDHRVESAAGLLGEQAARLVPGGRRGVEVRWRERGALE